MNNPLKYTDPSGYRYGPNPTDGNGIPYKNDMPGYAEPGVYAHPVYDSRGAIISFGFAGNNFNNSGFSYQEVLTGDDTDGDGEVDDNLRLDVVVVDNWAVSKSIETGYWITTGKVNKIEFSINNGSITLYEYEIIAKWVKYRDKISDQNDGGEQNELSTGTERGLGLFGSLWGGAATMSYADDMANGIVTTTKSMTYLKVGGNALGGLGFVATTYNNVVKLQNGTLDTADIVDWGVSGSMLVTGVLISNPVGLTVLAVVGIGYGVYRLTAGDAVDEKINEKFGFRQ